MTKSRTALIALALGACPGAAAAQLPSVEDTIRDLVQRECPRGADEITVCGRRERPERYRLPLPVERTPTRHDEAGGEQRAALAIDTSRCTAVGRDQDCGHVDFLGLGIRIVRAVVEGLERRRD
jgi:hypothetical protein